MSIPHLSNIKIEQRKHGLALICGCGICQHPIGYLQGDGKSRFTMKHGGDPHPSFMTADDHRKIAELLDEIEANDGTIDSERAA